ncbi:thioredoxin [Candidatus Dojkabacteria bacterium]|nr:thioredoxin [Candidatus Dojkabacteria bacterium]
MATQDLNTKDFSEKVLQSDKYTLVDFWAPWCGPCQMMAPVLEELSEDSELKDKLNIGKVNTEEPDNQELAYVFQIQSIPNMKLFYKGKVVNEFIGFRTKDQLKAELIRDIASD